MKKLALIVVVALMALNGASIAYSHCGTCGIEDGMVFFRDASCATADCTDANPCDMCKAKTLTEVCTNPDCTAENLCEMCKATLEHTHETAKE